MAKKKTRFEEAVEALADIWDHVPTQVKILVFHGTGTLLLMLGNLLQGQEFYTLEDFYNQALVLAGNIIVWYAGQLLSKSKK
jgi:hypothetical protein